MVQLAPVRIMLQRSGTRSVGRQRRCLRRHWSTAPLAGAGRPPASPLADETASIAPPSRPRPMDLVVGGIWDIEAWRLDSADRRFVAAREEIQSLSQSRAASSPPAGNQQDLSSAAAQAIWGACQHSVVLHQTGWALPVQRIGPPSPTEVLAAAVLANAEGLLLLKHGCAYTAPSLVPRSI